MIKNDKNMDSLGFNIHNGADTVGSFCLDTKWKQWQ